MTRFLAGLLAMLATFSAPGARAEQADIAAASRGVVRIVLVGQDQDGPSLIGHGSGIAVAPDVILTNAHVVDPARQDDSVRIGIVPSQGKSGWFGKVIAFAPMADLALVRLTERGGLPPATLFTGPVADGADVVAVGYPGNVDVAQGLNVGDIVLPTSPVKTRGSVSSGRSSKSFETILHTAPIGAGNSGGPLLDSCGRVVGVNSFGTLADQGDSEFYFAVSVHEIVRFLRAAGIVPRLTAMSCRSLADVERAEAERRAGERVHSEEAARALATRQREAAERAERAALLGVIADRENGLALAMLALVLALAAAAAAYALRDRDRLREARLAAGGGGVLVIAAIAAWLLRPGFAEVDTRVKLAAGKANAAATSGAAKRGGPLVCTLDQARSRLTVSSPDDLALDWTGTGCAKGQGPFGLDTGGWWRLTLSGDDDSATVARFDPATGAYSADRYFLDAATSGRLSEAARDLPPATCGDAAAARRLGQAQAPLKAMLPDTPNERLFYNCRPARSES